MLQRLYDILYEFREYVIFCGLIVFSLILLTLNDNSQVKWMRSAATVVLGVAEDKISFIPAYFGLRSENDLLHRVNMELADETQRLREAKLENLRLHQLLGLKEQSTYTLTAARVVNKNLNLFRNTLTLDVGLADSVHQNMPVVTDAGLVGLVASATEHYSVVNIIFNTDFRASAKIQRSRVDGIVAWDGRTLSLKNIPKMRDVKIGDVVVTTEYSSTFPADIRIGIVSGVRDQVNSLFKTITISPGVDFVRLEEVFVLGFLPDKERSDLEQRAASHQVK